MASVIALALVAGGLAFLVARRDRGRGDRVLAVKLVPADQPGEDPFTPSVAVAAPDGFSTDGEVAVVAGAPSPDEDAAGENQVLRVAETAGDSAGLFGSANGGDPLSVCDATALKLRLAADPTAARAWAELQGVREADTEARIDQLTPVVLGRDTVVTNSRYRSGRASTFLAILEAGTPVMVDDLGVPRVRCSCGNPLSPAPLRGEGESQQAVKVTLGGPSWAGFDRERISVVAAATSPVDTFDTVDIDDGTQVSVAVGSRPTPAAPETTNPPPTTDTAPATTPPATTASPTTAPPRSTAPQLTASSLGPLRMGMTIGDAQATGWLGRQNSTCSEQLEMGSVPGNESFSLNGPQAPSGFSGSIETDDDRITQIAVSSPVALPGGIDLDPEWSAYQAKVALERVGYRVTLQEIFEPDDSAQADYVDGSSFGLSFSGKTSVGLPAIYPCD